MLFTPKTSHRRTSIDEQSPPSRGAPCKWPPREPRGPVEAHGLNKRFGLIRAVNGVEPPGPPGSAFGYLAPTVPVRPTLIRVLLGLTRADCWHDVFARYPSPGNRDGGTARVLSAIVDEPRFHSHLPGTHKPAGFSLRHATCRAGPHRAIAGAFRPCAPCRRTGLGDSMGIRQRLGFAACLLGDPDCLFGQADERARAGGNGGDAVT